MRLCGSGRAANSFCSLSSSWLLSNSVILPCNAGATLWSLSYTDSKWRWTSLSRKTTRQYSRYLYVQDPLDLVSFLIYLPIYLPIELFEDRLVQLVKQVQSQRLIVPIKRRASQSFIVLIITYIRDKNSLLRIFLSWRSFASLRFLSSFSRRSLSAILLVDVMGSESTAAELAALTLIASMVDWSSDAIFAISWCWLWVRKIKGAKFPQSHFRFAPSTSLHRDHSHKCYWTNEEYIQWSPRITDLLM